MTNSRIRVRCRNVKELVGQRRVWVGAGREEEEYVGGRDRVRGDWVSFKGTFVQTEEGFGAARVSARSEIFRDVLNGMFSFTVQNQTPEIQRTMNVNLIHRAASVISGHYDEEGRS